MKVLITGANGMVARAAAALCCSIQDEVVALKRQELDITDRDAVFRSFENVRPEIVLNCAAYTDVDGAESNVDLCFAANALGPEYLASASREFDSVFVTVSSDYVFDGTKDGFYTQLDEPNPQSIYARSKLEGEQRAAAANPATVIVRSGWIYGEHGTNFLSVIPAFFASGRKIKAISDCYGTPTFAADLAARMRDLAARKTSGLFHAKNSGPGTSYLEFAHAVAELGGFDPELIESVTMDFLQRTAPRPVNSRLKCVRSAALGLLPQREWKLALAEFLGSQKR